LAPPTVRAIARDRVDRRLDRAWDVPLTTIVGPAGAGKTTAAAQLLRRRAGDVVWYRAGAGDVDERVFVARLSAAIEPVVGRRMVATDLAGLVRSIDEATGQLLIVIDEFDALVDTPTEVALAAAIYDLGPSVHLVTLSRHRPALNQSRRRLSDGVCEIGPDDLRFRSWEVDELFRDLYGRPLAYDEVAELERRTGGWVAALQLFHLATATRPAVERKAAIAHVGRRNGPDWDFLADNVLAELSDDLQLFLVESAPLERLSATLCDELLDVHTSSARLAELEVLQLVTPTPGEPGTSRVHEVLRAHLEGVLLEWEGAAMVAARSCAAAAVLERHGLFAEAVRAYSRGGDWPNASRLLGTRGPDAADRPAMWLPGLPSSVVVQDPWLLLAAARQHRDDGRPHDAIATYQRAEERSLSTASITIARRERLVLAALLDAGGHPSLAWAGAIRDAVASDPVAAKATIGGSSAVDGLAGGLCELLAGDVRAARATLQSVRDRADASATVALGSDMALLVARFLGGERDTEAADTVEQAAAASAIPFLQRLAHAIGALMWATPEQCSAVVRRCDAAGDEFGAALASALADLAAAWIGTATTSPDAEQRCDRLGMGTLSLWVRIARALASVNQAAATGVDGVATGVAALQPRRRGARPLHRLGALAAAALDGRDVSDDAVALEQSAGLVVPRAAVVARSPLVVPTISVRCLGGLQIDGCTSVSDGLRPRARTVLRMLAAHGRHGVHRQSICAELWPDDSDASATRKLHVAVSSVRRALEPLGLKILRRGDVYVLESPSGQTDLDEVVMITRAARRAVATGDVIEANRSFERLRRVYKGPLLPEEGASDWVVDMRSRLAAEAVTTAAELGGLLLDADTDGGAPAAAVCRWGLDIDRYCDPLWRLLLGALEAAGDHAGRARAAAAYDDVLAELGVATTSS
jgi:DNA-binding SARP family transcriptional activator